MLTLLISPIILFRKPSADSKNARTADVANSLLADDDHDGLQNWEEQIYGTDPHNPDTDGDGTPDGQEVREGRNPLIPGPDDKIVPGGAVAPNATSSAPTNLTQELFNEFIRQGGLSAILKENNPERASSILSQQVDRYIKSGKLSYDFSSASAPAYTKVNEDSSPRATREYLNRVAKILENNVSQLQKDDLDLLLEIYQSGDLDRLQELDPYRTAVLQAASEIRTLTVPKNLTWFHNREVKYLDTAAEQLRILENTRGDPVAALAVLPQRLDLKIEFITFHRGELASWLVKNHIELAPSDSTHYLID